MILTSYHSQRVNGRISPLLIRHTGDITAGLSKMLCLHLSLLILHSFRSLLTYGQIDEHPLQISELSEVSALEIGLLCTYNDALSTL